MTAERVDILVLSLGTTRGLRLADADLVGQLRRAGASVAAAGVRVGATRRLRRAYPVIDLVEGLAARRAFATALARHRPRAVIFSATTAALLAPRCPVPFAVRFDSPAVLNRPGQHNAVVHVMERRRLRAARLLLPWSHAAARALPAGGLAEVVVLPPPVVASRNGGDEAGEPRDPLLAVAYTPDPKAKGLDVVCAAWAAGAPAGARLEVFGVAPERARGFLERRDVREPDGVVWRGMTPASEFRAALRRARALVCGARWEDFGLTQLEALADGALLVTTPAGGAYEALTSARELDPALVAADLSPGALAGAIAASFERDHAQLAAYRAAAGRALDPFAPERIDALVAREVLPRLLA